MIEGSYNLDEGATLRGYRPGERVFQKRYTLQKILGRGGMGVVWLAVDESLQTEVALKFLPDLLVRDPMALADLKRETKRCLGLTHPHIVRVHHFEEDSSAGTAAIAMEYVSGGNLSNLRAEREHRHFEVEEIRGWISQLCDALYYAHSKAKVVHLDIKPANLMLDGRGDLKVADFGIARSLVDSVSRVSVQSSGSSSGTLAYMSPQQALGEPASPADDIYAFGATVFDLLTGRPPFFRGEIYEQLRNVTPPGIAQRRRELGFQGLEIPREWETTILACLEKKPEDRPPTMMEVALRLRSNAASPGGHDASEPLSLPAQPDPGTVPGRKKTFGILAGIVGVVVASAVGLWGWKHGFPHGPSVSAAAAASESAGLQSSVNPEKPPSGVRLLTGSLRVESVPSGVPFELRKVGGGTVASTVPGMVSPASVEGIPVGRYELIWKRRGWPERREEVQVGPDAPASVRRVWEEALVRIVTDPPGLPVRLDGGGPFTSPQTVEIAAGEHFVHVIREGWPEVREPRVLAKGENPEWKVAFGEGSLSLLSNLDSVSYQAFVIQGGSGQAAPAQAPAFSGNVPGEIPRLPTGGYSVVFHREGWGDQIMQVTVAKGEKKEVNALFPAGVLQCTSTPPGARVMVDGALLGVTPVEKRMPAGVRVVRWERQGASPVERQVVVENGQKLEIHERFPVASVELDSDPPGAEVRVEGNAVGTTPFRANDLQPGLHRWMVARKGFLPASFEAQLADGATAKKSVKLEEARFAGHWKGQPRFEVTGISPAEVEELRTLGDWTVDVAEDETLATFDKLEGSRVAKEGSALRWNSLLSVDGVRIEFRCTLDAAGTFRAELKGEVSGRKLQGKMTGRFVREPEGTR